MGGTSTITLIAFAYFLTKNPPQARLTVTIHPDRFKGAIIEIRKILDEHEIQYNYKENSSVEFKYHLPKYNLIILIKKETVHPKPFRTYTPDIWEGTISIIHVNNNNWNQAKEL